VDAPGKAFVLGLKELPASPAALRHRHVFFGHAYKGQPGADALLARFAEGGGQLLDLEHLCDERGRRLATFGHWAGYVGAGLALLRWDGALAAPLCALSRERLDRAVAGARADRPWPRVLVLGALGRSGRGARAAFARVGLSVTAWDIEQTREMDRATLLRHDIVVNAVLTTAYAEPFLTAADLISGERRLSVLADVTCDVRSPYHLFPLYQDTTTWDEPVLRLPAVQPPLDVIAIDNLPSLLPAESSISFSAALRPHIQALPDPTGVWGTCAAVFGRSHLLTRR
jgi:saccharopine dehydrogenase (NAD+, L-lysine-forming)